MKFPSLICCNYLHPHAETLTISLFCARLHQAQSPKDSISRTAFSPLTHTAWVTLSLQSFQKSPFPAFPYPNLISTTKLVTLFLCSQSLLLCIYYNTYHITLLLFKYLSSPLKPIILFSGFFYPYAQHSYQQRINVQQYDEWISILMLSPHLPKFLKKIKQCLSLFSVAITKHLGIDNLF
jgi:hypothetical protein